MERTKAIGLGIMIAAVVLFILGYAYVNAAEKALMAGHTFGPGGECVHEEEAVCPFQQLNKMALPKYIGLFADVGLFLFGLYLYLQKKPSEKALQKAKKAAKKLGGDEAKAFDLIAKSNGMIYQNELMKQMNVSKVKITRILDKLEAKELVERKRRGMTNVVTLKQ